MRRYLVATDFSPEADRLINLAVELAKMEGAVLILIHSTGAIGPAAPSRDSWSSLLQHARRALSSRRHHIEADGVPCDTVLSAKEPAEAIASCAEELPASLIAMACRRSNGRDDGLGHVTKRVIQLAPCPVMVVPLAAS